MAAVFYLVVLCLFRQSCLSEPELFLGFVAVSEFLIRSPVIRF